jgi:superfamily I DNA and RNA helicase
MEFLPSINQFKSNPAAMSLVESLQRLSAEHGLEKAILYHSFPLYKDDEGGLVVADCVLVAPSQGVIPFAIVGDTNKIGAESLRKAEGVGEQVPSFIHSRLIKNRALRRGPTKLAFDISPATYAPFLQTTPTGDITVVRTEGELSELLGQFSDEMPLEQFKELVATIEGAKGLIRPSKRAVEDQDPKSKGKQASLLEAAITLFDHQQKHGMMGAVTGPQRIRGLAGSGKTVVLAMKAAQTLLQNSDAKIAYTFNTKSLYQHVKRLITRFYRQFDDRDPDWDKNIHILHGWGGPSAPGMYSVACERHGAQPLSVAQAAMKTTGDKFSYACNELLKQVVIEPIYDYIFVDEGQDFPLAFMRLCHKLAKKGRFVLAYDDLQTIFQVSTPSAAEILGKDANGKDLEFEDDIVLHKCYRNPREVLVAAHAVGFGIYGDKTVQMLESSDLWEDVGYTVIEGDFTEGSQIVVERPAENSLGIISNLNPFDEIVRATSHENMEEELAAVVDSIRADLKDGLQPEDILVVSVDDRLAKTYLTRAEQQLGKHKIYCNNLQGDTFGIRDFSTDGRVTLSTVHKAKGNEAFMVYVVGSDACFLFPDVRKRNMLFTAMTRAKAWVRISGVGEGATRCVEEIETAREHFPKLVFKYPGPSELKLMKRDLAESADKKLRRRRLLEQLREEFGTDEFTPEELLKELSALDEQDKKKAAGKRKRK